MKGFTKSIVLFLTLFLLGTQTFAQLITRGPYLQVSTPTSMTIRWRTSLPTDTKIWFGTNLLNLTQTLSDLSLVTDHEITLTGLLPDTKYFYAIGELTGILTGGTADFSFITAPTSGTAKPFRAWILGDAGYANTNQRNVRDAYYNYVGSNKTDLMLFLGDNAYNDGTDTEYQNAMFENMYEDMLRKVVAYSCPGNHEVDPYSNPNDAPYWDIFTFPTGGEAGGVASGSEYYYSFDYGNVHFISLDSEASGKNASDPMMVWLNNDLAATNQKWIIAFIHQSPYTKGTHDSDLGSRAIDTREKILPTLEAYGVDMVISGHSHVYERSFMINGHYGYSSSFNSSTHLVDGGNGREDGDGAYEKPISGPEAGKGAVYVVTGSAGSTVNNFGTLDHPVHFYGDWQMGSSVLEVDGDELTLKFINSSSGIDDYFTMKKTDPNSGTLISQIANSNQDVEEYISNGNVSMASSDLELVNDPENSVGDQIIGLRFTNIAIPQGTNIASAYIQFTTDEISTTSTNLTIRGEAADAPLGWEATDPYNVSNRTLTTNFVDWGPAPWNTVGEAGLNQRSADIGPIVQEIINRPGFVEGNPINIIISGSGARIAESYDGSPTGAPSLVISYGAGGLIDQAISFDPISDKATTSAPFSIVASATSGLPVSFSIVSGPATVSGNTITLNGTPGIVTVRASQSGDASYNAAPDVDQAFTVNSANGGTTVSIQLSNSNQDVEEYVSNGFVSMASSDLEMSFDAENNIGDQLIGLRFTNVTVPAGETITNAYIQFTTDETSSGVTNLTIQAEAADAPLGWEATDPYNVSNRTWTSTSVAWAPPAWNTVGEAALDQQTPDLSAVIQEIIDRPGFVSGNPINVMISGTGSRTAESYDGFPAGAPTLFITYGSGGGSGQTITGQIALGNDDVEESESDGTVNFISSDLELVNDPNAGYNNQTVGLRFKDMNIPVGSVVTNAYVQFTVDEVSTGPASITIQGEASDAPIGWESIAYDVSTRPRTTASATWVPADWNTVGQAGEDQRSADITSVIQELLNRPGYDATDAIHIIMTGTGARIAESYDASPTDAPKLVVTIEGGAGQSQTITFGPLEDKEVTDSAFPLNATANSGLPVSFSVVSGPATISGNILTLNGTAGTVVVRASQAGDVTYLPASDVDQSFEVTNPGGTIAVSSQIAAGSDDVEESGVDGAIIANSSDIELTFDPDPIAQDQTVGLRFNNLNIPAGASIANAYIQFTVDEASSATTNVTIQAEAADAPAAWSTTPYDVSGRTKTTAAVQWIPTAWNTPGDANADQQSADISAVIQELVDRGGYSDTDAVNIIMTGTGSRISESFEGSSTGAAVLHVSYSNSGTTPQTITFDPISNKTITDGPFALTATSTSGLTVSFSVVSGPATVSGNTLTLDGTVGTVVVRASQVGDATYAPATIVERTFEVEDPSGGITVSSQIAAGSDDVEESGVDGAIIASSSDIELTFDPDPIAQDQTVGLRFNGMNIPAGANITGAYLQFTVDETSAGATTVTIQAEDADAPVAWTSTAYDVSSRTRTTASVQWTPPVWNGVGQSGPDQQSSDISSVIQELVLRPGYSETDAINIILTGTGSRIAESYEGSPSDAAELFITYNTNEQPFVCPTLDFNTFTVSSYGGQDGGSHQIQDGGATLFIENNAWKSIDLPYTFTDSTVIEFDFISTEEGELHEIGFDNNNVLGNDRRFLLYGSQSSSTLITDFSYTTPGVSQHFVIPVGQYFTGNMDRIFFSCDNDASPTFGNSSFSNISIYEGTCGPDDQTITFDPIADVAIDADPINLVATASSGLPVSLSIVSGPATISGNVLTLDGTVGTVTVRASQAGDANYNAAPDVDQTFDVLEVAPCPTLDFNTFSVSSYGGQDGGSHQIQDGGGTLFIENNAWKSINFPYTVTGDTYIEFDFMSTEEGELHEIGFDNNNTLGNDRRFQLYGTQGGSTLITDFSYTTPGVSQHFVIPVGQYFTGTQDRIFFSCDNDASPNFGNSYFSNISIYEGSCGPVVETNIWLEAECADNVGNQWIEGTDGSASNGEYVTIQSGSNSTNSAPTNANGHLVYQFDVVEAGTYKVWGRTIAPNGSDDSFWVRMDNDAFVKWNSIAQSSNWIWDEVHNADNGNQVVTYNLSAGTHTLTVAYREDGTQLDKLLVTADGTIPNGLGDDAENCTTVIADQTITFNALPDVLTTAAPFAVNATASSGLPVSFSIVSGPATISGNTLTLNGTSGTVTVRASQAGDASYNPAPDVDQSFAVNAAPVASFTATPEFGDAPLSVDFDASGSNDPDGIILGYAWDFGDGTNGTGVNPTHIYVNPGNYTASLIVMDDNNNTNSTTKQITANTSTGGSGGGDVLFVVGNTTLNAGDLEVKNRLEGLNFSVSVMLSTTASASDANGKAFVAISSTVNSGDVGATFRNVTVPVITWENYLYDDMRMTGLTAGTDYDQYYNETNVVISNSSHPLAAGLSGTVTATNLNDYRWGDPNNNAIVAAVDPSNSNHALSFGYEAGASMVGLTAPAKRVGFFLDDETASGLTANGWALFDAAICWMVDGCGTSPTAGTGTGLFATYYNEMNFTNPALTRVDPVVDFNWGTGSPDPVVGADTYSVRWEGEIEAQYTEVYTFTTNTDDGVQLWIDGQQIINQWIDQAPTVHTGTVSLTAGQKVSITMDYYENGGGAVAQLSWSSASQPIEIVPQTQLYPADPPVVSGSQILLVVGSTNLNSGDNAIKSQLEGQGHTVTVVDDAASTTGDANGMDLVVISTTVNSGSVNTKFRNVSVPVLVHEAFLFDDMRMTGTGNGSNYGSYNSQTQVVIQNSSHPMAAGLSGNVSVSSSSAFNWGVPGSNAAKVGVSTSSSNRALIFGYESGVNMVGLSAPARRVGFFFHNTTASAANSNGWALFDAAVCWAMNCGAGARLSQPEMVTSSLVDFEYYPNPLESRLNLSFTLENGQAVRLKVLDVLGKEVLGQEMYLETGKQRFKLDLSDLTPGYYFLTVEGENFFESHKLVKLSQE